MGDLHIMIGQGWSGEVMATIAAHARAERLFVRSSGLVLAALCFATARGTDGFAQNQPPQAQPQAQQQPQSGWVKLCDKVKVQADDQNDGAPENAQEVNLCFTFQERLHGQTGQLVVSVAMRQQDGEDGRHLMAVVPLGINMRQGLQTKVDGGKPLKLDWIRCSQAGCTAEAKVTPDLANAMKTGKQITVEGVGPRGKPLTFALPLTGFAEVDAGAASDAKKFQQSRQRLVSFIRARRAGDVKKALKELDTQKQAAPPK